MLNFNFYYLRFFLIVISIFSFLNILYSYYFDLYLNVDCYYYTFLISLAPLIGFLFFKRKDAKVNIYIKIITVIFGFFLLPIFISLPYFFSIYNISFFDAYFEAVSGFTSTGFTIFENIKHLDESLILWRSSSQWIGGLYFLFSILLLIDLFDENLKRSLTNYISLNSSEIFRQIFKIIVIYLSMTVLIFLMLKLVNIRSYDAYNYSLSIISSGGFLPNNNFDMTFNSDFSKIFLSISMLFSFFSLFFIFNLIFFKRKNINIFT